MKEEIHRDFYANNSLASWDKTDERNIEVL
jgi:hypothetical protein